MEPAVNVNVNINRHRSIDAVTFIPSLPPTRSTCSLKLINNDTVAFTMANVFDTDKHNLSIS
jgi:hypothetical protein